MMVIIITLICDRDLAILGDCIKVFLVHAHSISPNVIQSLLGLIGEYIQIGVAN